MPAPALNGKPTVAGGAGKASRSAGRKQQQMPMCDYGAACTRKGCIYRHPPKPKRDAASSQHSRGASVEEELRYDGGQLYPRSSFIEEYGEEQGAAFWERAERPTATPPPPGPDESAPVCVAFLAGLCTYGARCRGQHPPPDVADAFRRRFASTPCQWGDSCRTAGCLYLHPWSQWQEGRLTLAVAVAVAQAVALAVAVAVAVAVALALALALAVGLTLTLIL